jgi:hypothetical protein
MQESRHNIEHEQMHYDKVKIGSRSNQMREGTTIVARNFEESFAAYNACEKHLTSYKRNTPLHETL